MTNRGQWQKVSCVIAVAALTLSASLRAADLHFPQPVADAGEVRGGIALTHRFAFVNRGAAAVEVTEARASCGCLTPRLDKRVYQPGEQGAVALEVNTLTQPAGSHAWTIHVAAQGAGGPEETTLTLKANVVTEVLVQPAALTIFADGGVTHEITLTDLRPRPLAVTLVQPSSPHLKTQPQPPDHDAQGHKTQKIHLAIAPDLPEGRHAELIHLYTDDPLYRELKVPITVVKRPQQRLLATPTRVTFSAPKGQAIASQLLRLRDKSGEKVELERVDADDAALVCTHAQGTHEIGTVKITVDRTHLPAAGLRSAVHLRVRKPIEETLTIPVTVVPE